MAPAGELNVLPEKVRWSHPAYPGHPDDHEIKQEKTKQGFKCSDCGKDDYRGRFRYCCVSKGCSIKHHQSCALKQDASNNADADGGCSRGTSKMFNPCPPLPAAREAASQHNNVSAVKKKVSNADDARGGGRRGASRLFNSCPPLPRGAGGSKPGRQ